VSPDKLPFLNHQHILRKLESKEGLDSLVECAMPFLEERLNPGYRRRESSIDVQGDA
jgi:hypothetical protein